MYINVLKQHNLQIPVTLNHSKKELSTLVDTGTDVCTISSAHTPLHDLQKDDAIICAASPSYVPKNLGQKLIEFNIKEVTFRQNFKVVTELDQDMILGTNWCLRHKVLINCSAKCVEIASNLKIPMDPAYIQKLEQDYAVKVENHAITLLQNIYVLPKSTIRVKLLSLIHISEPTRPY